MKSKLSECTQGSKEWSEALKENNDNANELIKTNDFSVYAESFRILASNLKYIIKAKGDSKSSIILFTSSVKGEGKTTISMNTAVNKSAVTGFQLKLKTV